MVVLLSVVTLGVYWFYLVYQWSQEINGLIGEPKYKPWLMVLLSIATLGVGGCVIECCFAWEIEKLARRRGLSHDVPYPTAWVISLNVAALMACFIPFVGPFIAMALGVSATGIVQHELEALPITS
jgi:hypothetical protein